MMPQRLDLTKHNREVSAVRERMHHSAQEQANERETMLCAFAL